ncbi:MAG: ATP-binding protein, partial [Granulosicoccus sp.]
RYNPPFLTILGDGTLVLSEPVIGTFKMQNDEKLEHFGPPPEGEHLQLFHASNMIRGHLEGWTTEGVRARLFDARGWLVADVNKLYTTSENDLTDDQASSFNGVFDALLLRIFSLLVADDLPLLPERRSASVNFSLSDERRATVPGDQPFTSRYVTDENDRVLGTLAPIGQNPQRGYLLLEANEEHASAYAGSQLARLFSLLLLVSLLAGCGLLIFALVLSSRIRRLSHEAQQAISVDGRVSGLTGSDAQDEIGDLSRKLSSLLSRSAQYTQYLEALSSRLSHELRTPLSVVRTSLENLDIESLDEQSRVLVKRAEGGANQLGRIIKALVDSTRLEQSVQNATREQIDLAQWLPAIASVYRQIHPDMTFLVRPMELPSLKVMMSAELLQQAMDKLVDNAVSYATGETLVLQLTADHTVANNYAVLAVANQGPGINEADSPQLFDPLISHRPDNTDELHLGLGLYMVRLIAEGSGGEVFARNQDDWVVFGLTLPLT